MTRETSGCDALTNAVRSSSHARSRLMYVFGWPAQSDAKRDALRSKSTNHEKANDSTSTS